MEFYAVFWPPSSQIKVKRAEPQSLARRPPRREVPVQFLTGLFCCVFGKDTLLWQCLSPLRSINGFIFFSEGTVTNPTIWLVLSAVRIFLSLSTGKITLSWVAEYISTFVAIFPRYILFCWPGTLLSKVFLGKSCRLKNLFILSFFSPITLVVGKKLFSKWIFGNKCVNRDLKQSERQRQGRLWLKN